MANPTTNTQKQLFIIIDKFLSELGAERAKQAITLHALLEQELGLGSLEKAELFYRIEKTFTVHLPVSLLAEAKTVEDILHAIEKASPPERIQHYHAAHVPIKSTKVKPSGAKTLIDVLLSYAEHEPQRPHLYLQDENGHEKIITYGQLFDNATEIAKGLVASGLKVGETVAIMLPTSAEFFYAFFGILLMGGIPVPIYPPFRPDQIESYIKREALILRNAQVRILITFQQAVSLSHLLKNFIPSLKEIMTVDALRYPREVLPPLSIESNDPAMIQYTSGSTGNPKGVLLTHYNLLSNIRIYGEAAQIRPTDVVVSWLPLYHDMGLIGAWLGSFYYGIPAIILSPLTFLTRPERWLWAIHYHRASLSAGPNFSYELCVRKIDDAVIEGLDLSSWRLAFNGAEAIYPKTLERFVKKFSPYGFTAEKFFPVYGLAESSVALTFPTPGQKPKIDRIARGPFEKEGRAVPVIASERNALEFVCCGAPLSGHEIRIVDEAGQVLPERRVGILQFRGPSSMQGYYRNPVATAEVYHEGWWDSGDLAYIVDGEVYIAGRKKDVIIKAGHNLYPTEVEEIAEQVLGVRKGCVVAFGVKDLIHGTEKLVIVAETREKLATTHQRMIAEIIEKINTTIGIPPDEVIIVPPRTIPKTSSGKLQRSACLNAYQNNRLGKRQKPAWRQIIGLSLSGFYKRIRVGIGQIGRFFYTFYVWITLLTLLPIWLSIKFVARDTFEKLLQNWARIAIKLVGWPLKITGAENLQQKSPVIFIANHSSYIDAVILISILPPGNIFVAKEELLAAPVLGSFIKKLNYLTVNRADYAQSLNNTAAIQQALKENYSILFFPEGTFTYATGLRTFKLGAFKIAAETGIPICPIALQGTRNILRSGSHLFRPGFIKVHIGKILMPQSKAWSEIIRLRDEARKDIATYCGEPTIDLIRAGYQDE